MEALYFFETLLPKYKTTRCHKPEDHYMNLHRRGNLKLCYVLKLIRMLSDEICALLGFYSLLGLLDPWRWERLVVLKRRYGTTILRCKIPKERRSHYVAAEAWNHACLPKVCVLHVCTIFLNGKCITHKPYINRVIPMLQLVGCHKELLTYWSVHLIDCEKWRANCWIFPVLDTFALEWVILFLLFPVCFVID